MTTEGPKLKKILVATYGLRKGNAYYLLWKNSGRPNYRLTLSKKRASFSIGD